MATIRPSGLYWRPAERATRVRARPPVRRSRAGGRPHDGRQIVEGVRVARSTACRRSRLRRVRCADRRAARPRAVWLEIMTTGNGRRRMTFSRNASPSIFGISTSRVITSGLSALIASRASSGSDASPTTSITGSWDRAAAIRPRIVAESSTTSTRTGLHALPRGVELIGGDARRCEGARPPAR